MLLLTSASMVAKNAMKALSRNSAKGSMKRWVYGKGLSTALQTLLATVVVVLDDVTINVLLLVHTFPIVTTTGMLLKAKAVAAITRLITPNIRVKTKSLVVNMRLKYAIMRYAHSTIYTVTSAAIATSSMWGKTCVL